jgi:23S rRNA pseudouridine1911/1915/1917 synthase
MASIGHPVVGDTLYGGAAQLRDQQAAEVALSRAAKKNANLETLRLGRNFLHAAKLEFAHPLTGKQLQLEAPLPEELTYFLGRLESATAPSALQEARAGGAKALRANASAPIIKKLLK